MNIFSLGATWLNNILNTIWLSICSVLYKFINWLYQVFESVARVNLFSEEVFQEITSRIYIVMGIAMLFIFAYNLVLMIVNPDDKKSTGATTKIVKETIISLVVVVLLPTIFNYMYIFQNRVLSTNIIGQIIMGGFGSVNSSNCSADDYECSCDFSDFDELKKYGTGEDKSLFVEGFTEGSKDVYQSLIDKCNHYKNDLTDSQKGAYSIAPTVFSAFYRPAGYDMDECEEYLRTGSSSKIDTDQKKQICTNFFYDIEMSKFTGNIDGFVNDEYLKLTMSTDEGVIDFDWLFAIVAGGLAVWMFLCYAMEIGVRVAKLGVLQIISPITVMMRIVPGQKEKIYKKWFDQLMNTYLDVFVRLMIIYFSLFAISLVPDVIDTLFASFYSGQSNWFIETLALVIVILGILKFGQEAPDLIKDFVGSSGNFALRSPAKQLKENKLAMGGLGAAGTMGNRFLNKAGNYRHIAKNKEMSRGKKVWEGVKNTGSMFNPVGYGKAAAQGFNATKDGKDFLKNVNSASAEHLASKGMLYKAKKLGGDVFDQMKHYATADYMGLNADGLKRQNNLINAIMGAGKTAFDRVENDKRLAQVNDYYAKRKDEEAKAGNFDAVQALEKERKEAAKSVRAAIAKEKTYGNEVIMKQDGDKISAMNKVEVDASKIDVAFKNAMDDLHANLKENFSSIEGILKETNASFKDLENNALPNEFKALSDELMNGNTTLIDDMNKKLGQKLDANNVELTKIKELNEGKKDK